MNIKPPAPRPCDTCPYRKDVPSGVWDESEYRKLPEYDKPTGEQPLGMFLCHQQNGRMCAGWVAVHDMEHNLALRFALRDMPETVVASILAYQTDVPLFGSGAEAAQHGLREIKTVGARAIQKIQKIQRKKTLR